ncbi:MAG: bifunctional (p)ppGpp synthetase/guanosine-3',5'-bis(diphosphate) 3'-pyrophosphohydrolase [Deltaproteobacteria bacterium]|nr:bifunctional (p)ppGpp synthetase/guanosine-3',5'-bis(diphosphate) 3'-pyrophosphohydrolase [Deltaproteobacteria bacterium]
MASAWSPEVYALALELAARAHGAQKTPHGLPYLAHVTAVCAEVQRALMEERELDGDLAVACALLHDTLEDTALDPREVSRLFGERVLEGLRALTKDPSVPKDARMDDSLRRLRLRPREVWLVKLADRTVNLGPAPSHWSLDKRRAYLAEGGRILQALGEASAWQAARLSARMARYGEGL